MSISVPFKYVENQKFIDYVANKLEQNNESIFEIVCMNDLEGTEVKHKGFFNITKYQREKIVKIIRDKKWEDEVFDKHLFGEMIYVHTFQIR
jgi:hypothetical protein